MNFGARLLRASGYGIVVGVLFGMLFSIAGAVLNVMTGNTAPLTPQQMSLLGFGLGFAAPVALDLSKAFEESTKSQ